MCLASLNYSQKMELTMCLSIENQTHMTSTVFIFCVYVSEIACGCKIDYGFLDFKEELICI